MDIRDLQVFLAVTTRLNFTRAGEDVHLSQPSVSVRIRQLERELGEKLFEQLGKRVALTEAGRLLEPYARRVVAAMDDALHAVEELQGLERGTVRVGASTTPGTYLVPTIIARFKRDHPKVEIRLSVRDTRHGAAICQASRPTTPFLRHTLASQGCRSSGSPGGR